MKLQRKIHALLGIAVICLHQSRVVINFLPFYFQSHHQHILLIFIQNILNHKICCHFVPGSFIVGNVAFCNKSLPVHAAYLKAHGIDFFPIRMNNNRKNTCIVHRCNGIPHLCDIHLIDISMQFIDLIISLLEIHHRQCCLCHRRSHITVIFICCYAKYNNCHEKKCYKHNRFNYFLIH